MRGLFTLLCRMSSHFLVLIIFILFGCGSHHHRHHSFRSIPVSFYLACFSQFLRSNSGSTADQFVCCFSTLLVKSQKAVCDRFCCHCVNRRSNPFRFIRNTHSIKLPGDFFCGQFFGEVFYTGDFILCIRLVGDAV